MSAISIPLADERSGRTKLRQAWAMTASAVVLAVGAGLSVTPAEAQEKRPNIVMLMTDDTGWNDFGTYSGGGAALGHPTPAIRRVLPNVRCWL